MRKILLILLSILRGYHKTGLRGGNKTTMFLAGRIKSFQKLPLPTSSGEIYVDLRIPVSHRFLKSYQSTGEDVVMKRLVKAGNVVYDIGANFGEYSLLLSNLVGADGKVFAFEPNSELLDNLKLTISQKSNIELFPVALSDTEGTATLFIPEDVSMASLGNWTKDFNAKGELHENLCQVKKLDNLVKTENLPFPQFIKCDVEGAELSVMRGGLSVFNRIDAPIFMFEVNSVASKGMKNDSLISDFLDALPLPQYKYFEILENGDLKQINSTDLHWSNVIAIPARKLTVLDKN